MIDWYLLPLAAVVDSLYVFWMWAAEKGRPHLGGLASVGIWGLSTWGVITVINNRWNLAPILVGAYLGTCLTIYWKKHHDQ